MTNRENAVARANEIDKRIIETVQLGRSFRVEAGAGAGKTYSLKIVIDWLEHEKNCNSRKKDRMLLVSLIRMPLLM